MAPGPGSGSAGTALGIPAQTPRGHRIGRAVAYMGGTAAVFSIMNAMVKYLSRDYPTAEIVWARTAGHFLFILALFGPLRGCRLLSTRQPVFQLSRSILLVSSTALYFSALRSVGLATAAVVSFTAPLFVALLAGPVLGEQVRIARWLAIGAGFAGAVVVIRPGFDVAQSATLLVLASALCYAGYQLLTRSVAGRDPPETTVAYSALVGTVVMTVVVPFSWKTPESAWNAGLLGTLGILGGLGHYCLARAYSWGPAAVVSPLNYLQLIGATLTGYLLFGDAPDAFTWLGAALIVGSGLAIIVDERRPRGWG